MVGAVVECGSQIGTGRSDVAASSSRSERTGDWYSSSGYRPLDDRPAGLDSALTDREFAFFVGLARAQAGIALGPAKRTMLAGRLQKVLAQRGLATFGEYVELLRTGDREVVGQFIDAITTNLTAFFREGHHFAYLRDRALPELLKARRDTRRLRLWSAGCSTGEEAYSIALVLQAACAGSTWDARVLATDIDETVVQTAANGVYSAERLANVPDEYRRAGFQRGTGARSGQIRVRPEIARLVSVRRLNLMAAWPMQARYDVIFCRNVLIYFDKDTQGALVDRFAGMLQPEGLLFIGHSESLFQVSERFAPLGQTIYRKVS